MLTHLKDINERFKEFYTEIYTSKLKATLKILISFLIRCSFLNWMLLSSELQDPIRAFPTGEVAGLDGFRPEFYQGFQGTLAPSLLRMIRNTFKKK